MQFAKFSVHNLAFKIQCAQFSVYNLVCAIQFELFSMQNLVSLALMSIHTCSTSAATWSTRPYYKTSASQLIRDKGDCRTAPATPGLLIIPQVRQGGYLDQGHLGAAQLVVDNFISVSESVTSLLCRLRTKCLLLQWSLLKCPAGLTVCQYSPVH